MKKLIGKVVHYARVAYAWFLRHVLGALLPSVRAALEEHDRQAARAKDIRDKLASGRYEPAAVFKKVKPRLVLDRVSRDGVIEVVGAHLEGKLPWGWRFAGLVLRAVSQRRRRTKAIMKAAGADYFSGRQRRKFRKGFNRALRAKQRELNQPRPTIVSMSGAAVGGSSVAA